MMVIWALRKAGALALLTGAVLTPLAQAQSLPSTSEKSFAVEGPGVLKCSSFMNARNDKTSLEYQRFIGFAEGYLSAANLYEPNTFDLSPWHNATAFDLILSNHCESRGEEIFVNVLQRMVSSFRPIRVAEFSPMFEVGNGESRALIYETILRRAQIALRQRGFYSGPDNARFSPELQNALLEFQRSHELLETGVPDPATLWTLLNP